MRYGALASEDSTCSGRCDPEVSSLQLQLKGVRERDERIAALEAKARAQEAAMRDQEDQHRRAEQLTSSQVRELFLSSFGTATTPVL